MKSSLYSPALILITLLMGCESREVISDVQTILQQDKGMITIPEGSFMMGAQGANDEGPVHEVYLSAYAISQNLVTNRQYLEFWEASDGGRSRDFTPIQAGSLPWPQIVSRLPQHPVVGISWLDAKAYAEWKGDQTGIPHRLPTEAEWEKAARGTDQRTYPWGNTLPYSNGKYFANFWQEDSPQDGFIRTSPVTYFNGININTMDGVSPYGIYDMAGNVWEWVEDWYDFNYYRNSPYRDPKGPAGDSQGRKVIRGGSYENSAGGIRVTNREGEFYKSKLEFIGFRLVIESVSIE